MFTTGTTISTQGKATTKAKPQAFSQRILKPSTQPILNNVITKDIRHDIKTAMKKEKTNGR